MGGVGGGVCCFVLLKYKGLPTYDNGSVSSVTKNNFAVLCNPIDHSSSSLQSKSQWRFDPCLYQTLLRYSPDKQSVSEGKFGVFRLDV